MTPCKIEMELHLWWLILRKTTLAQLVRKRAPLVPVSHRMSPHLAR